MHTKREAKITSAVLGIGDIGSWLMPISFVAGAVLLVGAYFLSLIMPGSESGFSRFSHSYLTNFCFFASISIGALFFVIIQHLTRAGWSVSVRRIAEILAMCILPMLVLFLPIFIPVLFGNGALYEWAGAGWAQENAIHLTKSAYLNPSFFGIRNILYFVIWAAMAWFFLSSSTSQDQSGDKSLTLKMQKYSAPLMIVLAATIVFSSMDWEMSLAPMWFSTMWPVYFFAGAVLSALAAIILIALLLQRSGRVTDEITVDHYHDLAKLSFAFVVFWGYIAFSQFMLIWYANIPEETHWYAYRFKSGWAVLSALLIFGHILIPFLALMSRTTCRSKPFLLGASIYLLIWHWIDHFWIVMPQLSHGERFPFPFIEILCLLGMGAMYMGCFFLMAGDRPMVPLKDPRLGECLNFHKP
jgi:hypothetical protein